MKEHHKNTENDEVIDFSKIKNSIKNFFAGFSAKGNASHKSDNYFVKNRTWIIPLMFLFIAFSFSIFMRIQPAYLPITDTWAESSIHNSLKNQIEQSIGRQYPNLPDENRAVLIDSELQKVLEEQSGQLSQQKEALSQQYKSKFQDENGQTYLLAIDPYYWYGLARNKVLNGHYGDSINEAGDSVYLLRSGREDKPIPNSLNPTFMVYLYKIMHFFNSNVTLLGAVFYLPLIIVTLTILPIFFITRKIAGNVGGLFAGVIFAVNNALLGRTPAGFADTDPYNVFFPALIAWMLIEMLDAKDIKNKVIYGSLSGFFTGMFAWAWSGWGFMFDFVLATLGIVFAFNMVKWFMKKDVKESKQKMIDMVSATGIYLFFSAIFVTMLKNFSSFSGAFFRPLKFIKIKDVAVSTVWPNVMTTVAEFNEQSLSTIMVQMGGKILFVLAIVGIFLTLLRKTKDNKYDIKYFTLLIIWFVGTTYAFTKGTRFAILMVPAFAIALGVCLGTIYKYISKWISAELSINDFVSKSVVFVLLALLLISPVKSAYGVSLNEIPSFTDSWNEALQEIHDDSDDGIITSWWDFGHWFVAMGKRRVTFDGGDQGRRIHWVGRSLITNDEKESLAILKMLNCGQEKGEEVLNEYIGDSYKSVMLLKDIIMLNKEDAQSKLILNGLSQEEVDSVLKLTHCEDLIENYMITSEDMIGKAGVWGHFGSWNFTKAKMFNSVRAAGNYEKGVSILKSDFAMSASEADNIYYEITTQEADKWIAPWPGYLSKLQGCNQQENMLQCSNGLEVDLLTMNGYVNTQAGRIQVKKLAYLNRENDFVVRESEIDSPYGAALIPDGNSFKSIIMPVEQTASMFTRMFFFGGHGLEHFKPFSNKRTVNGLQILTYKVDFDGGDKVVVDKFLPQLTEVRAKHILFKVAEDISEEDKKVVFDKAMDVLAKAQSGEDFSVLAKEYSEGPSSVMGGDLNWFTKGRMVKAFEDAAFGLELGEVSKPVLTQFGYHLIKQTGQKRGNVVKELDAESSVLSTLDDLKKVLEDEKSVEDEEVVSDEKTVEEKEVVEDSNLSND